MAPDGKIASALKAILRTLTAVLFVICLLLFRPLSWLLALLFVILSIGSCVSSLSIWVPVACFATLLGLHLFIEFYPMEELERRWGLAPPRTPPRRRH